MRKLMIFEVCCGSLSDAINAEKGGADRIELNSALFLGGLSPDIGTLKLVKKYVKIPVMVMLRPREGGFCYSDYEFETILANAEEFIKAGANGLVFGFLNEDGNINIERTQMLCEMCKNAGIQSVFHRAIDVTPDVFSSLKILNEIGIDRVLTSGGETSAVLAKDTIRSMVRETQKTEILPGGGIRKENVVEFVKYTGVNGVHTSARKIYYDNSVNNNPEIYFGGGINGEYLPENEYKVTDVDAVKTIKELISK